MTHPNASQSTEPAQQAAAAEGVRRRQLGHWVLGAAAALGLAACGGGSGDADEPISLREAYDRLQEGMTMKQVYDLVGRTPAYSSNTHYSYASDGETLYVGFSPDANNSPDQYIFRQAEWTGNGQSLTK